MNTLTKIFRRVQKARILGNMRDASRPKLARVGTQNGGWHIPASAIRPGMTAVCVGAGEDISFDVELNKKGMIVFTLDPTPRAKKHVEQVLTAASSGGTMAINNSSTEHYDLSGFDRTRFTFVDAGMWDEDKVTEFFAPKDPSHVSHSIVNLQRTSESFEARCLRLQTFCRSYNIAEPDILKLDIEGAEYTVLKDLARSGLRPRVLCVDFDEGNVPADGDYLTRIADSIRSLKELGYRFLHMDGWNFLFVLAQ